MIEAMTLFSALIATLFAGLALTAVRKGTTERKQPVRVDKRAR